MNDPFTEFVFPIFDSFGPNRKIAGALATGLYWRLNLKGALPDDTQGVIVVLRNAYGQVFSFRLDGVSNSNKLVIQLCTYFFGSIHFLTFHVETPIAGGNLPRSRRLP